MQGKTKPLLRYLETKLKRLLKSRYSCLILGPRQVGKTTLAKKVLEKTKNVLSYPLQNPSVKIEMEANPGKIIGEIEACKNHPYVFIDEAQKVPEVFDAVQFLIDEGKANFLLTGSSARKLKRKGANLLPGRIKRFFLDPLMWSELGFVKENYFKPLAMANINENVSYSLEESLIYGSLPGIISLPRKDRGDFLKAYSEIYLEEEIRAEALSRKIGAFSRFLELAANESGTSPNLANLSMESGVSLPSINEFYQVLNDTLIVERVEPYLKKARKRILSSPRYYFFDLGVRNVLSRLPLEPGLIQAQKGVLFEHLIILEIIRRIRALSKNYKVCFWRTSGGAEVDCVLDMGEKIIPIEIKASQRVSLSDINGLRIFLEDYKNIAKQGYVITMGQRKEKLAENITAIPWFCL